MTHVFRLILLGMLMALLSACGTSSKQRAGGYYQDDGPGSKIPANIAAIPDAVPRIEPHARANSRPYRVMGKSYTPMAGSRPFQQVGIASWYGRQFHGKSTANGERYDMYAMTAAHPTLPLPSYARVTHLGNGRSIIVRVNDRGPFLHARVIDLSYAAAAKLGFINQGSARVRVEAITHDDIRAQSGPLLASAASAPAPAPTAVTPTAVQTLAIAPVQSSPAVVPPAATVTPTMTTPDALGALAHDQNAATHTTPALFSDTTPTPRATSGIFLQFGAFSTASSAQALAQRLNAKISLTEPQQAHIQPHNGLHRVRIGPYPDRTTAVNAAYRIQQHTGKHATLALH